MLSAVRSFFAEHDVLEVDTPILRPAAPIDAHIDVMRVEIGPKKIGYLHTSPEYELKKLLSCGSGDIYQLSHVFRYGEEGPLHNVEFMMLEWYRTEMTYDLFIEEVIDLIRLFLGDLSSEICTYREVLRRYAKIDYCSDVDLLEKLQENNINLSDEMKGADKDTLLSLLFTELVEPHLGRGILSIITDYPASQAALAKKASVDGNLVAKRFEIFAEGIELANGYDELTDAKEQRMRLNDENQKRLALGKESLPIDEEFLSALESGLPNCCGVAVGFDRLMMLRNKLTSLADSKPTLGRWESVCQH